MFESETMSRLRGKNGVRFFGDIHGCHAEFAALAADALERNLHLHSLGDLINRGPDSPSCMLLACDLYDSGWLDLNPGNHDERFLRWFKGEKVPIKPNGLGSTLAQLESVADRETLIRRYADLMLRAPLWSRFGRIYSVHAALHAEMIGHSVASTDGLRERRNEAGGRIVHLDTGLQRSGRLSYIDVPMPVIECRDEPAIEAFPQVSDVEIRVTRAEKHRHT